MLFARRAARRRCWRELFERGSVVFCAHKAALLVRVISILRMLHDLWVFGMHPANHDGPSFQYVCERVKVFAIGRDEEGLLKGAAAGVRRYGVCYSSPQSL